MAFDSCVSCNPINSIKICVHMHFGESKISSPHLDHLLHLFARDLHLSDIVTQTVQRLIDFIE